MKEAIEAMKNAYALFPAGRLWCRFGWALPIPESEALSLSCRLCPFNGRPGAGDQSCLCSQTIPRGLAYIQAAVLAFDPETGRAIRAARRQFPNGNPYGRGKRRAIDLLGRKDSSVAAILARGTGTHSAKRRAPRKIETAFIYDANVDKARAFVEEMKGKGHIPGILFCWQRQRPSNMQMLSAQPQLPYDLSFRTGMSKQGLISPRLVHTGQTCKKSRRDICSAPKSSWIRDRGVAGGGGLIQPMRSGFSMNHTFTGN